jgi:hypothetical protein
MTGSREEGSSGASGQRQVQGNLSSPERPHLPCRTAADHATRPPTLARPNAVLANRLGASNLRRPAPTAARRQRPPSDRLPEPHRPCLRRATRSCWLASMEFVRTFSSISRPEPRAAFTGDQRSETAAKRTTATARCPAMGLSRFSPTASSPTTPRRCQTAGR